MNKRSTGPSDRPMPDIDELVSGMRKSLGPQPAVPVQPRLEPDEIMRRVRVEVAKRRGLPLDPGQVALPAESPGQEGGLARWRSSALPDAAKREFILPELLEASDETFIATAYRALLRREPDQGGLAYYLGLLRTGGMSKVEVLGALRWSPEGRARSVHVDGLLAPYLLQKWQRKPLIGPIVGWTQALLRLGALSRRQQLHDAAAAREAHGLGSTINHLSLQLQSRLQELEDANTRNALGFSEKLAAFQAELGTRASIEALAETDQRLLQFASSLATQLETLRPLPAALLAAERSLSEKLATVDASLARQLQASTQASIEALAERDERLLQLASGLASSKDAMEKRLELFQARVESMQFQLETLHPLPAALLAAERSLGSLLEQVEQVGSASQAEREQLARHGEELAAHRSTLHDYGAALSLMNQAKAKELESARALDPLYVAFEDEFRGSRDLILARAEPYLDLVREAGLGSVDAPVLDLGCGRGEWLDLLREHGLVGRGVDSNRVFVDLCEGRGLDVIEGDVIEVMQSLPGGSIGAITGMHIAEHLPFEVLVQLLDEARRLLRPGGLLALETPNPENLQVATHFFYMDPTHRNPIPPEAFRWLVEARGFDQVRIERWTVARETGAPPLLDGEIPGAGSMNVLLSQLDAALDYSIIARRGMA
jgi:Methylase involved in ubiquinone/menaquinone biosynthesis